ncbi:glycosyltransferase family 4 protein, partial [Candidatus Bathyarchaeota archaeon]|nr:glycosyltransferase family 4 protein [Candidatus Bathyarchaeota archaeon]
SLIEGFGLSVAEAMACEKPVIATAVGGHLDQIVDGFNGFLVPPNDPLTLAERLEFLIYNPDIRIKLGKNARKVCKEKFDINKRIKAILDLYEMILSIRT